MIGVAMHIMNMITVCIFISCPFFSKWLEVLQLPWSRLSHPTSLGLIYALLIEGRRNKRMIENLVRQDAAVSVSVLPYISFGIKVNFLKSKIC